MMAESNSNIERLINLIRQRDLTDAEWDSFIEAGENDPFLQDALEGLRAIPHEERKVRLDRISARINSRSGRKRRVLYYRIGAVASILLLVAAVAYMGSGLLSSNETPYARQETELQSASEESTDESIGMKEASTPANEELNTTVPPAPSGESVRSVNPPIPAAAKRTRDQVSGVVAADEELVENKSIATEHIDRVPLAKKGVEATPSDPKPDSPEVMTSRGAKTQAQAAYADGVNVSAGQQPDKNTKDFASSARNDANANEPVYSDTYTITGTITGDDSQPLPGANVQLEGSQLGTTTDMDGRYRLELPKDSNYQNANLVASYIGYQTGSAQINNQSDVDIRLSESTALEEVVVTGYQKPTRTRKNYPSGNQSYALAQPLGGWKDFYQYIRKEISIPDEAVSANIEGTVWLEFDLSPEGSPENFRIIESLGYGCDEEAIRLVQEGPKWDVESAQVPIGRVSIDF